MTKTKPFLRVFKHLTTTEAKMKPTITLFGDTQTVCYSSYENNYKQLFFYKHGLRNLRN